MKNVIKHIHMLGIGGTGMASLAGLFQQKGFKVTGTDGEIYPPMSDQLKEMKIETFKGYNPDNLKKARPDLVIVGNVISRNNPEVEAVIKESIPYMSMPQAVSNFFLKGKHPIVIAGTHGKTTTSNLMAWVLESAGLSPSFLIGGIGKNFNKSYKLGSGEFFVIEGDEYDTAFFDKGPKFLHYQPKSVILTSIEYDHADIYKNLDQITVAFKKLTNLIPEDGNLIAYADSPHVCALLPLVKTNVSTYGLNNEADFHCKSFQFNHDGTIFEINYQDQIHVFKTKLFGLHNLQNCLGVVGLCLKLGIDIKKITKGLATFEGVKRRQEIIKNSGDITIIDDFAHHPTAVKCTIEAIKLHFKNQRVWAVFEPRSNTSRRNIFQKEFSEALANADFAILAKVYRPENIPSNELLDAKAVIEEVKKLGTDASYIENVDDIVKFLKDNVKPKDVILIMSNGGFDNIYQKLSQEL